MEFFIQRVGGATAILRIGELRIAIDPVLCPKGSVQDYFWFKSRRIEEPRYAPHDFDQIDLWLITHNHEDHLDAPGIRQIRGEAEVICNGNARKKLLREGKGHLKVLKRGRQMTLSRKGFDIYVEAIPAIHGVNPLSALLAGRGNGYYLRISGGGETCSIYFTGDTVLKEKIFKALGDRRVDLLLPNMGAAMQGSWIMTLTLNARMLERMIARLHPRLVVPLHYGTFEHYREPSEKIEALARPEIMMLSPGREVRLPL